MSPPGPLLVQINFNPRTPVGCDDELSPASVTTLRFQSTHPSGVRHAPLADRVKAIEISIHAPQWGATTRYAHLRVAALFQSTHPSGVRLCCPWSLPRRSAISIHAPQWGATRRDRRLDRAMRISIHAPQWGATARMGIAFHNTEAPSVLKTDFIAKIHVHRSIHKFSNQKHQQTIHF